MSCVTHYCPATSMPQWFEEPQKRGIEPYWDAGGFASSFYVLPNLGQIVRPTRAMGILQLMQQATP